jgi:2-phospho-L-lactate guanylyltransferase
MTPTPGPIPWWVIVPVKGAPAGKSRLEGAHTDRAALSRAIALDTLDAVAAALPADSIVLVCSDPVISRYAEGRGLLCIPDPATGLNAAIRHADSAIGARERQLPHAPDDIPRAVAALLGDLPSLRPQDLIDALTLAASYDRAFVPDREGTGTVLLTDRTGTLHPRFGEGSAERHEKSGYLRLDIDSPRLRTDVDTAADLAAALQLGCGPNVAKVLADASVSFR